MRTQFDLLCFSSHELYVAHMNLTLLSVVQSNYDFSIKIDRKLKRKLEITNNYHSIPLYVKDMFCDHSEISEV